jgi:hypothetical protein
MSIKAERSVVLDDALQREVGACKFTCSFDFPGINDDEVMRFVSLMTAALD